MATYVAEGAKSKNHANVRIKPVELATREDIFWCDALAVGKPTNMGLLSWKMKRFWNEEMWDDRGKIDEKIGCVFSSSGGWGDGSELTCMVLLTILINFGFLVFGVRDYVSHQFTLHYGSVVAGEPRSKKEQDACLKLGERFAEWVHLYVDKQWNTI